MNPIYYGAAFALALAFGSVVALEIGRRIGTRRLAEEGEAATKGFGALEGALFALLGLILAFLFSGALARFDARRQLVVEEANDIGTAWLRLDLVPVESQPPLRDLFRRYLDSRLEVYRKLPDLDAAKVELVRSAKLQGEIWSMAVSASRAAGTSQAPMLLLPALNDMIDITTTRTESARFHPPVIIFAMLGALVIACSLFAGYDMGGRRRLSPLHCISFSVVLAVTVYVNIDLEYPRLGLIRLNDSDQVLVDLRKSME